MAGEVPEDTIGRYQVLGQLGQGAMGRVLMATDPVLDREVAIKLLRDDLKIQGDQRAALQKRMRQEARASARVSHPNIVLLHDMGEDPRYGLYLVFEYVAGATLKQRLEQGPLKAAAAARLAKELGSALSTAHRAGVLHRDIKPDNIILATSGAKIADFGIARVPDSTLTRDGGLLGTPAYSSPESIATGHFSPQSDQFSMAATLYEAISGIRAFPGQDAVAVATKISSEEPLPVAASRGLGPEVDEVLSRALAKNAADRFASAQEFGEALAHALGEGVSRTSMATLPDQRHAELDSVAGRTPSRRAALGGAALGALLTILLFQLTEQLRERPRAISATPSTDHSASARTANTVPAPHAIGWLAESPPERPKHARGSRDLELSDEDVEQESPLPAGSGVPFDPRKPATHDGVAPKAAVPPGATDTREE